MVPARRAVRAGREMRCAQCGRDYVEIEELHVDNLSFVTSQRIAGTVLVKANCAACGVYEYPVEAEVEVQMPNLHQNIGHDLEIDFLPLVPSWTRLSFPVRIRCSCGDMEAQGFLILRRGN